MRKIKTKPRQFFLDKYKTIAKMKEAADAGDVDAMATTGVVLVFGTYGAKQNQALGVKYLWAAVKKGSVRAAAWIGEGLYYGAYGIEKDEPRGLKFLTRAAGAGNSLAASVLTQINPPIPVIAPQLSSSTAALVKNSLLGKRALEEVQPTKHLKLSAQAKDEQSEQSLKKVKPTELPAYRDSAQDYKSALLQDESLMSDVHFPKPQKRF